MMRRRPSLSWITGLLLLASAGPLGCRQPDDDPIGISAGGVWSARTDGNQGEGWHVGLSFERATGTEMAFMLHLAADVIEIGENQSRRFGL